MPQKCHVTNCTKPVVSRGLCDTHRKRRERHGHTGPTRAADWGAREKHPAYRAWCNLIRYHRQQMPATWIADFWTFAGAVPSKPDGKCSIARPEPNKPWSSTNFYWKEPRLAKDKAASHAAYMREYQRTMRAADPDHGRNDKLRRNYGVDLIWYNAKLEEQHYVCAICDQPETMKIKGKTVALAVDHCHDTGIVRGLLCTACNRAIGLLKHNRELFLRAIDYLG